MKHQAFHRVSIANFPIDIFYSYDFSTNVWIQKLNLFWFVFLTKSSCAKKIISICFNTIEFYIMKSRSGCQKNWESIADRKKLGQLQIMRRMCMPLILKIHKVWFCSLHKTTRHYSNSFLLHYVPDSLKYRKLTFFSNCSKVDGQLNEQESINKQIPCNMIWEKCHFRNIVVIYILLYTLSELHYE